MNYPKFLLPMLAILLFTSGAANAAVIGWGAATTNSTASYCPSNGLCTSSQTNGDFAYNGDGGDGQTSASSSETTYGTSNASSTLSGTSYTPTLKTYAKADDNGGAFALAMGVQGYTYSGANKTIMLDLSLTATIDDGSEGLAEAFAKIAVIFTDQLDFYTNFGTAVFEAAPTDSVRAITQTDLRITSSSNGNSHSLSFDVMDGDQFLVWAGLEAKAWRGAEADAFSTLTMMFDDPDGLAAAGTPPVVGAVPLPAGAWLFFTGIAALAGLARREKQSLPG
jgi:hypothetical protein